MLRTILAGLDGSPDSQSVLTLGIRWARRFDALLVGIAIIDEPESTGRRNGCWARPASCTS